MPHRCALRPEQTYEKVETDKDVFRREMKNEISIDHRCCSPLNKRPKVTVKHTWPWSSSATTAMLEYKT